MRINESLWKNDQSMPHASFNVSQLGELNRDTMVATNFFSLPEEGETFSKYIQDIHVNQNSNVLQNGLECLAEAINSNWEDDLPWKRQIIIVWSNAGTQDFMIRRNCNRAPGALDDFEALTTLWEERSLRCHNRFLVLYTPDTTYWSRISSEWDSVIHFCSGAGQGLDEMTYQKIMNAVLHGIYE